MGTEIIKNCCFCGKEIKAIHKITIAKKHITSAFEAVAFNSCSHHIVKYFNNKFNYFCDIDCYNKGKQNEHK